MTGGVVRFLTVAQAEASPVLLTEAAAGRAASCLSGISFWGTVSHQ
jgi:hypothetical protein